jgi:soluble lytic murein transglycosylase
MLSRYREPLRAWTDPIGHLLFRLRLRPNHLTLAGLGVSFVAAAAFMTGRTRLGGVLLLLAGLFDFFDGSLARASGQVTPFGAFLDSVIDRYSDLIVLLAIVVLFVQMPHARGALVAMAALVGSVMVSYTKARAESIGVECNVGMMERPERMICLIAGALLDLLEPALWLLAVLANLTALQRIVYTRRAARDAALLGLSLALIAGAAFSARAEPPGEAAVSVEAELAWARAVADFQAGDPRGLLREFGSAAVLGGSIGDYAWFLLADARERVGDLAGAKAAALAVAERHKDSRLAPAALLLGAVLAERAGDEPGAQTLLTRLVTAYPDSFEVPEALYLSGALGEARGKREAAALAYREVRVLAPVSSWAIGAEDRLMALTEAGVRVPPLSVVQRMDRAERLLRGGVPKTASEEAERISKETSDPGVVVRALRVMAEASQRLGRPDVAAKTLEAAAARAPADRRPGLMLQQGQLLLRANQREQALIVFANVEARGTEAEAAEAAYQRAYTLDEMDRDAQAAALYKAVAKRYPTRERAGEALWRLGWIEYAKGEVKTAGQTWLKLTEIPGGRSLRLPALYWAGRAQEQVAGPESAAPLYRRVLGEAPRSYYGLLAAKRVAPVDAPDPAIRLPADPREALADDPGFARADLLRRIGLVEFAVQELDDVVLRSVGDPLRLYGVSGAFAQEARYHLALRILRRNFAGAAVTGHAVLPRSFWEMLYPFGWRAEIYEAADRAGLDPFLVAAVVREESSYYPRAISPAGARGLMQLMPRTAQPMAELRGLAFGDGDLLDDPRVNLQLGATFLAGLLKEWKDPRMALAAYNAGPARARQWWKDRRSDDMEAFVELIPYDETRRYVKRVILGWEEYRRIYGPR